MPMGLFDDVVGKIFKKEGAANTPVNNRPNHPVFGEEGYEAPAGAGNPGFVNAGADLPPNFESRKVDNTGIPSNINQQHAAPVAQEAHPVQQPSNVHTESGQHFEVKEVKPSVPQMKHADVWEVKIETTLQVISSKMDAVKSMVENIERRVANIEQVAMREQQQQQQGKRW